MKKESIEQSVVEQIKQRAEETAENIVTEIRRRNHLAEKAIKQGKEAIARVESYFKDASLTPEELYEKVNGEYNTLAKGGERLGY